MKKKISNIYISIIIILLFVIFAFSALHCHIKRYYKKYSQVRIFNKINISDAYDDLKSGDLIIFKGHGSPEWSLACDCYFKHASIVLRYSPEDMIKYGKKSEIYIVESSPTCVYLPIDYKNIKKYDKNSCNIDPIVDKLIGWTCTDGLQILPLLVRLKYCYGNDHYLMKLNKPLNIDRQKILIDEIHKSTIRHLSLINIFRKKKFHCFQQVIYLLDKMKLTDNLIKNSNVLTSCNKLVYIYKIILNDNYMYDKPMQILYDF